MTIIHPTCYNREGHCLHWIQRCVDEIPWLVFGNELAGSNCSTVPRVTPSKNGCGNPWNYVSEEYGNEIRKTQPARTDPPTNGHRPVTSIEFVEGRTKMEKVLEDLIGGDCWSVYSREPKTHKVIETFFFNRADAVDIEHEEETKRVQLTGAKLCDVLNTGIEVCVSLGGTPFMDAYATRVSEDRYMIVTVEV